MVENKKGVSAVVANVLIILLVIVSIGVIWAVVRPTIQSAGEQINSDCFNLLISAKSCGLNSHCVGGFNDGGTCTTNTDCEDGVNDGVCTLDEVVVDVGRDPGPGTLSDIRFVFDGSVSGVLSANDDETSGAPLRLSRTP